MTTFSAATSGTTSGSAPRSTEQLRWKREETRNSVPSRRRTGETGACPSSGHRPRDHPRTGGPLPPASRSHSPRFPPAGREISPALPLHPCHFRPWPRLLGSPPSSPLSLMHVPASPPTPGFIAILRCVSADLWICTQPNVKLSRAPGSLWGQRASPHEPRGWARQLGDQSLPTNKMRTHACRCGQQGQATESHEAHGDFRSGRGGVQPPARPASGHFHIHRPIGSLPQPRQQWTQIPIPLRTLEAKPR